MKMSSILFVISSLDYSRGAGLFLPFTKVRLWVNERMCTGRGRLRKWCMVSCWWRWW